MHFGLKIQKARMINNVSVIELAKKVNVTEAYIINLENGKIHNPSFFKMMTIAKILGLDVHGLKESCFDPDWIKLMKEAKSMGMTPDEIQTFIDGKAFLSAK